MNTPLTKHEEKAAGDDWTKILVHCAECGAQFLRKVRHQKYCDEHRHLAGAVIRPQEALTSNLKSMRERMLRDEERSEQAFEELSQLIALEAHEDRLKLWEDNERLRAALEVISNQTNSTAEVSTLATTARRALSGDSFTPETAADGRQWRWFANFYGAVLGRVKTANSLDDAKCLAKSALEREWSSEETSRKLPPRQFDVDTHQGLYAEKASPELPESLRDPVKVMQRVRDMPDLELPSPECWVKGCGRPRTIGGFCSEHQHLSPNGKAD